MRTIALVLMLAVAGCATPEQRADEMAGYINEAYGPTCVKLGYATGSDGHRNCMLSLYNTDQVRNATPWWRGRR